MLSSADRDRLRALYPDLSNSVERCVTCRGAGTFRWRGPDGEPADYECNCPEQFMLHRWLLRSGIEKHYQRLRWDDALGVEDAVLKVVDDYIAHVEQYLAAGLGLV